jgi:hypothetical protein
MNLIFEVDKKKNNSEILTVLGKTISILTITSYNFFYEVLRSREKIWVEKERRQQTAVSALRIWDIIEPEFNKMTFIFIGFISCNYSRPCSGCLKLIKLGLGFITSHLWVLVGYFI